LRDWGHVVMRDDPLAELVAFDGRVIEGAAAEGLAAHR